MENLVFFKHNCSNKGFISFDSIKSFICPFCQYIIGDWSLSIKIILAFPFSASLPSKVVLMFTRSNNLKHFSILHIGISNSKGSVYHFNEKGLKIDQNGWYQCLNYSFEEIVKSKSLFKSKNYVNEISFTTHLDKILANSLKQQRWKREEYDSYNNNCFDYVLGIVNSFLYLISKDQTSNFIKKPRSLFELESKLKFQKQCFLSNINSAIYFNNMNFFNYGNNIKQIKSNLNQNDFFLKTLNQLNLITNDSNFKSINRNTFPLKKSISCPDVHLLERLTFLSYNNKKISSYDKLIFDYNEMVKSANDNFTMSNMLFDNNELSKKSIYNSLTRSENNIISDNLDDLLDLNQLNHTDPHMFNKFELTFLLLPLYKEAENYLMIYESVKSNKIYLCI